MADDIPGERKTMPIDIEAINVLLDYLSDGEFERGHSYHLRDSNEYLGFSFVPVTAEVGCSRCDQQILVGQGIKISRKQLEELSKTSNGVSFNEQTMTLFLHYRHLGR